MQLAAPTLLDSSPRTLDDWLGQHLPAGRDLRSAELLQLATSIGRRPEFWQGHTRHDIEERFYALLHRDDHVEVWLLCWTDGQGTDVHDHDGSEGAFYICEGTLIEDRYDAVTPLSAGALLRHRVRSRFQAGDGVSLDASCIHAVRHEAGEPPATSIHAYSPPLGTMGYYDTAPVVVSNQADLPAQAAFWARSEEM
jgi:predicted metal-dependent enzyme (double-stranded beta helix superfamily)